MKPIKSWAFKTIEKSELIYKGNNGYDGNPHSSYSYDNYVANHKQVRKGDLVIIYDRSKIIGISLINELNSVDALKEINKCPIVNCDAKKLRTRTNRKPEWRCSNGHEFTTPRKINIPIKKFTAIYNENFQEINKPYSLLERNIIRHNKQLSIQEVNLEWSIALLEGAQHKLDSLNISDAENDSVIFEKSDLRESINRTIKQRRGQKSFRDNLLSHKKTCAITNCNIVDILEAAHIFPYRNNSHNQISNGVLLRADIHTLFDIDMIAISPIDHTIHLNDTLKKSEYYSLNGKSININHKLSREALESRWILFHEKNSLKK